MNSEYQTPPSGPSFANNYYFNPNPASHDYCRLLTSSITHFLQKKALMKHHRMGLLEWECTVCLCPIKSSCKLIVSYPLLMHNENEILKK